MPERILVTGSNGFIGKQLIKQLREKYPESIIVGISREGETDGFIQENKYQELRCDITNHVDVSCLMNALVPTKIFHLAGNPIVCLNEVNPTEATITNVIGTQNLLHYCPPKTKFIFASSATVYGDYQFPSQEHYTLLPSSAYGATKVGAEAMVLAYHNMGRVSGVILRYIANVGEGATHGVVKDFIDKLKSSSATLDIIGGYPGSRKPYMHVSDTASATIYLSNIESDTLFPIYNISLSELLSCEDIARICMFVSKIYKTVKWLGDDSNWAGDNKLVKISHDKLDATGWKPQYETSSSAVAQAVKELV